MLRIRPATTRPSSASAAEQGTPSARARERVRPNRARMRPRSRGHPARSSIGTWRTGLHVERKQSRFARAAGSLVEGRHRRRQRRLMPSSRQRAPGATRVDGRLEYCASGWVAPIPRPRLPLAGDEIARARATQWVAPGLPAAAAPQGAPGAAMGPPCAARRRALAGVRRRPATRTTLFPVLRSTLSRLLARAAPFPGLAAFAFSGVHFFRLSARRLTRCSMSESTGPFTAGTCRRSIQASSSERFTVRDRSFP